MKIKLKEDSIQYLDFDKLENGTIFEYLCDGDTSYGIKVEVYDNFDGFLNIELNVVFEYEEGYKITKVINANLVEE